MDFTGVRASNLFAAAGQNAGNTSMPNIFYNGPQPGLFRVSSTGDQTNQRGTPVVENNDESLGGMGSYFLDEDEDIDQSDEEPIKDIKETEDSPIKEANNPMEPKDETSREKSTSPKRSPRGDSSENSDATADSDRIRIDPNYKWLLKDLNLSNKKRVIDVTALLEQNEAQSKNEQHNLEQV